MRQAFVGRSADDLNNSRRQWEQMRRILIGALGAVFAGMAAALVVAYQGWINVAADAPHGQAVGAIIEFARERSIARRIGGIVPPPDLDSPERMRRGAGNYEAMCAECHLAPGVGNSELRRGLYPAPPKLAEAGRVALPRPEENARRFWIIKHGIKASGMPAWGAGGMSDEDIWDLTAFIAALPGMSPAQYRREVAASGGHSHGGQPAEPEGTPSGGAAEAPAHDHSTHAH